MKLDLKELFEKDNELLEKTVILNGWVRNHRKQKEFGFIDFYDGTCFKTLQIVYTNRLMNFEEISKIRIGSSIEVKGKFNTAKIFTDVIDNASLGQVKSLCDQEFAAGSKIRMMPDIHAGAGCTVGTTMTIKDKVVPNLVGVDIGCGMEIVKIRETRMIFQKLDKFIRENIPSGLEVRRTNHKTGNHLNFRAAYNFQLFSFRTDERCLRIYIIIRICSCRNRMIIHETGQLPLRTINIQFIDCMIIQVLRNQTLCIHTVDQLQNLFILF